MVLSINNFIRIFITVTNKAIDFVSYLFGDKKTIQPETHVLPPVPEESPLKEQIIMERPSIGNLETFDLMSSSMETVDLNTEPLDYIINEVRLMSRTPTPTPSVSSSNSWEVVSEHDELLTETKILSNP